MKARRDSYWWLKSSRILVLIGSLSFLVAACDVFLPRAPEEPTRQAGTFFQPDTPNHVISNIENAVAELNVQNYRRSLAEDLVFRPATTAEATSPIFAGWSASDEERYFSTLAAASDETAQHQLRITDRTMSPVGSDRYIMDGLYVLTVNHNRAEAPREVQGRLTWIIAQDADGLWRLKEWSDQELSSGIPTWSTLKAEFGR